MDTVVIGLYGSTLDSPVGARRWDRWRPTVSLFQAEDLEIARLELLHAPAHLDGVRRVVGDIANLSPSTQVRLHPYELSDPWDFEEVYSLLHDWALAYPFRPEDEDYLVHITTGSHVVQICLFLLTEARLIPGRLVQSSPPQRGEQPRLSLIDLDLARYSRLAARSAARRTQATGLLKSGIPTRNEVFNRLIERVEQVAGNGTSPILLQGPTGAGKTWLARQIHALKRARHLLNGPLVELNCATLRGETAMSTLFGHVRGAYTGAQQARPGLLRAANGGCLFLDEVGELGLDEQAMLLTAIEDGRFLPVGADQPVESRFQLVCGSNRPLRERVARGLFREDLLARIDLWTFELPGLRQRPEDIEPNLDFELERWRERTGRQLRFTRQARARFLRFATDPRSAWAGNFRDLNAAVSRMATLASGGRIEEAEVEEEIARLLRSWGEQPRDQEVGAELLAGLELDRFDRVQLQDVLSVCRESPSLSEAGRRLFAVSRQTRTSRNDADRLRKYLARFGLSWELVAPSKVDPPALPSSETGAPR